MEDSQIVQLYLDRDEDAIRQTEMKYAKLCHGIALHILGDEQDAEECVNDTYLGVWNAIPPTEPKSLKAFVSKIARNISLRRLEYNSAEKRTAPEMIEFSELAEVLADDNALSHGTDEALGTIISDFLYMEKEDARLVFVRKYWYFDTVEEISVRFGFSESRVKSMLFHTRHRLKHYLKMKGVQV